MAIKEKLRVKVFKKKEVYLKCDRCNFEINKGYLGDKESNDAVRRHNSDHDLFDSTKIGDKVRGKYMIEDGYCAYFNGVIVKMDSQNLKILVESSTESRNWFRISSIREGTGWDGFPLDWFMY